MSFSQYYPEFITIALAHLIAVASPGPDFAIVLKHSVSYGRRVALLTSLGIGSAIFLHVTYALAGIGLIISSMPWLYNALIIVASMFLLYIGYHSVRSKPHDVVVNTEHLAATLSDKKAFSIGFLTNGLNPKATLFFLSLFTVIVAPSTPIAVKAGYGIYLAIATTLWFTLLSLLMSHRSVRQLFSHYGYWFDRVMGVVLIGLAMRILYQLWLDA